MIGNKKNYIILNRRDRRRRVQRAYSSIRVRDFFIYILLFFKTLFRSNFSRVRVLALDRDRQRCSGGGFYMENIKKN